jgi:hypothetical protein
MFTWKILMPYRPRNPAIDSDTSPSPSLNTRGTPRHRRRALPQDMHSFLTAKPSPTALPKAGSMKTMHPEMDDAYYMIRHDVRGYWSVS